MTTYSYDGCERTPEAATAFTVTKYNEDYSMDCDGLVGVVADTLATVIRELIKQGILKGSVTTA